MFFEDCIPGAVYEFGEYRVTEAEIIEFARRYDPQTMHTDPAGAAQGHFGGLIASGWHTGSIMMRLIADHFLDPRASIASPGIDEMRWVKPVRPGDVLRLRVTILDKTRSRSKPDRGMVRTFVEILDQHGEVKMSLKPMNLLRCREPLAPAAGAQE